jgi:hypothetical protein
VLSANVVSIEWNERHDVRYLLVFIVPSLKYLGRYYIVYVFRGAGLTGNRSNLIADVGGLIIRHVEISAHNSIVCPIRPERADDQ